MTRRSLEIKVGIAVVVASLILIVGIMWLQRFKLVEKRYSFFVHFPEVGGLTKDDPIMINGVERGRVKQVELERVGVIVEMGVKAGVAFPVDSQVTLRSIGIMGERYVSIRSGSEEETVQPGDTLTGRLEAGLSEVMGEAGRILGELVETSSNLKTILESLTAEGRLEESMSNLASFSEGLKKIAGNDSSPLISTVEKLNGVVCKVDSLINNRYATLDSSLSSFSRAGGKMERAMDDISSAAKELKELTAQLNSGEGTIGRLVKDDTLVEKLDKTVTDLNALIDDIKKHPGRYLSIRLF